jgi:hypothetical protein
VGATARIRPRPFQRDQDANKADHERARERGREEGGRGFLRRQQILFDSKLQGVLKPG